MVFWFRLIIRNLNFGLSRVLKIKLWFNSSVWNFNFVLIRMTEKRNSTHLILRKLNFNSTRCSEIEFWSNSSVRKFRPNSSVRKPNFGPYWMSEIWILTQIDCQKYEFWYYSIGQKLNFCSTRVLEYLNFDKIWESKNRILVQKGQVSEIWIFKGKI